MRSMTQIIIYSTVVYNFKLCCCYRSQCGKFFVTLHPCHLHVAKTTLPTNHCQGEGEENLKNKLLKNWRKNCTTQITVIGNPLPIHILIWMENVYNWRMKTMTTQIVSRNYLLRVRKENRAYFQKLLISP